MYAACSEGHEITAKLMLLHGADPLAKAVAALGLSTYGSPTLSDQALMPFPTIKFGPGDSARSHTADEFIRLTEIIAGIKTYLSLLGQLKFDESWITKV